MYNENVKLVFMDTLLQNLKKDFAVLFSLTAEKEMAAGKDIAEFTRDESIAIVNSLGYSQYESVNNSIVKIKRYKKWYDKEYQKNFLLRDFDFYARDADLSECFRKQLIYKLDCVTSVPETCKPSNGSIVLPFLVLSYYGLSSFEIIKLDREDVVFGNSSITVHYNGKKCRITDPTAVKILRDFNSFEEGKNLAGAQMKRVDTSRFMYKTRRFTKENERFDSDAGWTNGSVLVAINYCRSKITDDLQQQRMLVTNVRSSGVYHKIVDLLSDNPEADFRDISNMIRGKEIRKANSDLLRFSVRDYMKAFESEMRNDYGGKYDSVFQIVSE